MLGCFKTLSAGSRRASLPTRAILLVVAACSVAWALGGCVFPAITPEVSAMVPTVARAFDCTVGLYVPPESAEYQYVWSFWFLSRTIHFGGPAKGASLQTLKQLFAQAYEMPAPSPRPGDPEPDFVIVQTIEKTNSWVETPFTGAPKFHGEIEVMSEVRGPGGSPLFSFTNTVHQTTAPASEGRPGEPEEVFWRRFVESAGKRLLSDFANDLVNQYAGTFSAFVARRARTVAFLGWTYPSDLESVASLLSEQVRQAMARQGYELLSEDAVGAVLAPQPVSLAQVITDTSRIVAIARSLKCGVVVVGQIEAIGDNLRLRLIKFDGQTGKEMARGEAEAQPDDVKGLIDAVDSMVSSLELAEPAP